MLCGLFVVGPWLRPPISRDFRGNHVPWGITASGSVWPESETIVPRPWRIDSVANPLLLVIGVGSVICLVRPPAVSLVFGLLLATAIPAVAATLCNHPALIAFFEDELLQRALLRHTFQYHGEHLLTAESPDRIAALGSKATKVELLSQHRLLLPFRYASWGLCIVPLAGICVLLTTPGGWPRRLQRTICCTLAGLLLTIPVISRRAIAEYHWMQATSLEQRNYFDKAAEQLAAVEQVMPSLGETTTYWLERGRVDLRRGAVHSRYAISFTAQQALYNRQLEQARAELERLVAMQENHLVVRQLLAQTLGLRAVEYLSVAKPGAAEACWQQCRHIAPWSPGYLVAHTVTLLRSAPEAASEMESMLQPLNRQLGDRMVRGDVSSIVGDAYFQLGMFDKAREMYAHGLAILNLPKYVNVHAQEGRLGL